MTVERFYIYYSEGGRREVVPSSDYDALAARLAHEQATNANLLRALASGPTITLTLDEVRALYKFLHGTAGTGQSQ